MEANARYGDIDNVRRDARALFEIHARQGNGFIIEVLAEYAGTSAIKFKMTAPERETLIANLVNDLESALRERL